MLIPPAPRPRTVSALVGWLVATSLVLVISGCSQLAPFGPGDGAIQLPPPRHLAAPIVVQVMGVQPATATGDCPAGWIGVSLPAGGGPRPVTTAVPVGSPQPVTPSAPAGSAGASAGSAVASAGSAGASTASPAPSAAPGASTCYRPTGTPVTISSAAISSVGTFVPPAGEANEPDMYGFIVAVPAADVAAVTAVIRRAYDSHSAVGISVAGKLWEAPMALTPFRGLRLQVSLPSRNQALQLYRTLVPAG